MNTARYGVGGTGIQTSALAFGGYDGPSGLAVTESMEWICVD